MTSLSFGGILAAEDVAYVAGFFEVQLLKSGEDFLSLGKISNRVGFIDEGILRSYSVGAAGEEVTKYFIRENQYVVEIESFYNNTPSQSALQAVTDCRLLAIRRDTWHKLQEEVPKLFILTKSLTEAGLLNKIKDNEFLHYGSARDKYQEFMRRYPTYILKVPLQYIASYLHITPQSLSRIRRDID